MILGKIHSLESFGTVDGPGIRYVVFMQGCVLRCQYCHNPDTWSLDGGSLLSTDEILEKFQRNAEFYQQGGITVTGGEPLLQMPFVTELFRKAKTLKIHTCLDTSGITYLKKNQAEFDALMAVTDLVLLDIKQIDAHRHQQLTAVDNSAILQFARYLSKKQIPVWIRHVYVNETINPEETLKKLGRFLGTLDNVKMIDVLPYHTMGLSKYEQLKLAYPLQGTLPADKEQAKQARALIVQAYRQTKLNQRKQKS